MSRKHFSWLLVVTLAVALLVLLMPGKTGRESALEKSRLVPALQQQANEIDWLRFSGAGGRTIATLTRSEGGWRVEEMQSYAADWERLRALLADLAQAEVVEAKTANPEYYERLGVEDVARDDAGGVRLEFAAASGLPAIIFGDRAQGREGQYVRVEGVAESALIDRYLDLPAQALDWVEREIADVADAEVVEFEVRHPDGDTVRARKASADDEDFVLEGIPEGRETQSAWTVNSIANGLSMLTLDGVAPADSVDWEGAVRFGLVTADGLRLDADLVRAEAGDEAESPEFWLRLEAGLYRTAVESGVEGAAEPSAEAAAMGDVTGRAQRINERVGGWAYRIPQYKFDAMTRRMDDLLKPEDSATE